MSDKKFDPKLLNKLNNPERLKELPPEFIIEKIELTDPGVLIDIGAGTGFFSIPFSDFFKDSIVYACDISDIMIGWMKKNVSLEYKNIKALKMTENQVPLNNKIADFIYMINLHHELEDPAAILIECYRLIKFGGKIAISDWKKEEMNQGPPLEIRCDHRQISIQLQTAGFKKITVYNELIKNYLIIAEK